MRSAEKKPPRLAEWFLSAVTDSSISYSAIGDFEEQFQLVRQEHGLLGANTWYWWQILRSTPAFISDSLYWSLVMIKNYVKMAYRSLLKNKDISVSNASWAGPDLADGGIDLSGGGSYDLFAGL